MRQGVEAAGEALAREEGNNAVGGRIAVSGVDAVSKRAAEGKLATRALAGLGDDEGAISKFLFGWDSVRLGAKQQNNSNKYLQQRGM